MSYKDTGGYAFPMHMNINADDQAFTYGMTLRDYFAGQALAGLLASPNLDKSLPLNITIECSYKVADAMIAERNND